MSVAVELSKIIISELQDSQVIVLREVDGARAFPIVIGSAEAYAIDRRLKGISMPRPLTHDLLGSVIAAFDAKLSRIEINRLEGHTFFASLVVEKADGTTVSIDSRPSDAIALGIANAVPIFVAETVLETASTF
jgi:bifunctional DNase/RNase